MRREEVGSNIGSVGRTWVERKQSTTNLEGLLKVRSIIVSRALKDVYAGRDNVSREIRDEDNFPVGQMVVGHECLKVRAWYDGDFTASAVEICRDSLLLGAFVGCKLDIPKPCQSLGRRDAKDDLGVCVRRRFTEGKEKLEW